MFYVKYCLFYVGLVFFRFYFLLEVSGFNALQLIFFLIYSFYLVFICLIKIIYFVVSYSLD